MHVSVGATTVRIPESAARELQGALAQALAEIDRTRASFAPTPVLHLVDHRGDDDPEDGGPQLH